MCIVGTRPEVIKMAPVILALQADPEFSVVVVATAQHRQMLDQAMAEFGLAIDIDLDLMRENQTLSDLTARLFTGLPEIYGRVRPDFILAQGDTTTVFVSSVVAFYHRIPFGHVEAGLRTRDLYNPFPEEFNRLVAGRLAALHFAPTAGACENLLQERVPADQILVTGNTVIDALLMIAEHVTLPDRIPGRRSILMTAHRRENFGAPLCSAFEAVAELVRSRADVDVLYPVHPNPNVTEPARRILGGLPQVKLVEPLGYRELVAAMKQCDIVLTDSGGIQEEAPALGKPVLVMRSETERPEAITAGVAKLVGTDRQVILNEITTLLDNPIAYAQMARGSSPYGDGHAAGRIVAAIKAWFS